MPLRRKTPIYSGRNRTKQKPTKKLPNPPDETTKQSGNIICNKILHTGNKDKGNLILQMLENHRAEIIRKIGDRPHPELGTISCPRGDKPRWNTQQI